MASATSITAQGVLIGYAMSNQVEGLYNGEVAISLKVMLTPMDEDLANILRNTFRTYFEEQTILTIQMSPDEISNDYP